MHPLISFRTAFEKALERAGIEDFRFHDMRHTAASYLHMAGVDIKDIKGDWGLEDSENGGSIHSNLRQA